MSDKKAISDSCRGLSVSGVSPHPGCWRTGPISYFPKRRGDDKVQLGLSLNGILEQLPKLTEDEKRQLWNVLDEELGGEGEESPEFLAELDARVRALDHGARTYSVDQARQMVRDMVARARR